MNMTHTAQRQRASTKTIHPLPSWRFGAALAALGLSHPATPVADFEWSAGDLHVFHLAAHNLDDLSQRVAPIPVTCLEHAEALLLDARSCAVRADPSLWPAIPLYAGHQHVDFSRPIRWGAGVLAQWTAATGGLIAVRTSAVIQAADSALATAAAGGQPAYADRSLLKAMDRLHDAVRGRGATGALSGPHASRSLPTGAHNVRGPMIHGFSAA